MGKLQDATVEEKTFQTYFYIVFSSSFTLLPYLEILEAINCLCDTGSLKHSVEEDSWMKGLYFVVLMGTLTLW